MTNVSQWAPLLILIPVLGFTAYCMAELVHTPDSDLRTFSRTTWAAILTFGSVVGTLVWFALGRSPRRPTDGSSR